MVIEENQKNEKERLHKLIEKKTFSKWTKEKLHVLVDEFLSKNYLAISKDEKANQLNHFRIRNLNILKDISILEYEDFNDISMQLENSLSLILDQSIQNNTLYDKIKVNINNLFTFNTGINFSKK